MQKYKPKTPLANVSDRVLRVMITCGLGIGWFVYLWGMRLTALTAGVAFGGLLWLCARQFGKKSRCAASSAASWRWGGFC